MQKRKSIINYLNAREGGYTFTPYDKKKIDRMIALTNRLQKEFEENSKQGLPQLAQFCLNNPAYFRDAFQDINARNNKKHDFEIFFYQVLKHTLDVRFVGDFVTLRRVHIDALNILVEEYHVDVNAKLEVTPSVFFSPGITTPLHEAVLYRDVELTQKLLAWGADRNIQDHKNRTPYQALQEKITIEGGRDKTPLMVSDLENQLSELLISNN